MTEEFLKRLEREVLVIDGAMGTTLYSRGRRMEDCPEELNITHRDEVKDIHRAYFEAGCDIVITNTLGGTSFKLDKYDKRDMVHMFNLAGAKLAKEVARRFKNRYVAGDIGPTGELIEPLGKVTFDQLYTAFSEQVEALLEGGVDLFIIETMSAIEEVEAAIKAVKGNTDLPVIASMSYSPGQRGYRTMMGVDIETEVTRLTEASADVIGTNCGGVDIWQMAEIIEQMRELTSTYLIAEPNAGLPKLVGDKTVFDQSPEDMAAGVPKLLEAGVNIIGSCCGTTPAHTEKIANIVKSRKHLRSR